MKYSKILVLCALGAMPTAFGSVYVSDFSGAEIGDPLNGTDGWIPSEPDSSDDSPLGWINMHDGSKAAAIGGYYDAPTNDTYAVLHSIGGHLVGSTLSMDFGLMDSTNGYPVRNNFSISILSGGLSDVLTLNFVATSQTDNPEGEDHAWNMSWSSGGNTSEPFAAVFEGSAYNYDVSFDLGLNDEVEVTFTLSSKSNVWPTVTVPLTGVPANETFGFLRVGAETGTDDQGNPLDWGDNFLAFRGVPEPSAAMLVLLSAVGLLRRRR